MLTRAQGIKKKQLNFSLTENSWRGSKTKLTKFRGDAREDQENKPDVE